jgi:hypothetical protein
MKLRPVICILLMLCLVLSLAPTAAAAEPDPLALAIQDACIFNRETDLSRYAINRDQLEQTFDALYDSGQLPWYTADRFNYSYSEQTQLVKTFQPYALYDGNLDMAAYEEKAAEILAACVFPGMEQWQIALSLHDYLIANTAYDETLAKNNAYDVLINGAAVCLGYAQVYQDLLGRVGIASRVVVSDPMNHAWNLVQLDGSWYHVDLTWDDPTPDVPGYVSHRFFLLTDEEIASDEKPHYDWVTDITCADTRFSGGFWRGVENQICYESSDICYLLRTDNWTNSIYRRNESAGEEALIYQVADKYINLGYGKYMYQHFGLSLRDGRLWFSTQTQLISMKTDGTDRRTEYTNTGNTYIYCSWVTGDTAVLSLMTHGGNRSAHQLTLEPSNSHAHSFTRTVYPVSCTENGYTYSVCACGLEAWSAPVKATNHTYYTTAAQEPSLFAAGFATYTCDDCGDSYTDPLPKTTIQEFLDDNGFFVALAAWVVFLGIRALVRGRKQDDSIC